MPVAAAIPYVLGAVSAGATVYSAVQQRKAANNAADTTRAVAEYNAKVDDSEARQIDLDAKENVRSMRRDASTYMSRQRAAYAASGVRVDSGSPLAVRAITAGRFALQQQQYLSDSKLKQERLRSAGQAGIRDGQAQADAYHAQGVAAIMSGAGKLAGQLYGDYQSGLFDWTRGTGTSNLSGSLAPGAADLPTATPGTAYA